MKKWLCALLALALLAGTFALAEDGTDLVNMNDFAAWTLDGHVFTQDDLKPYDLTVVNVWSITCGPCINEMPELAAFGRALPENVQLIAICPDASYALDSVQEFLADVGFEGATLTYGEGDFVSQMARVMYTPTTFFLDADGNLAGEVMIGSPQDLEAAYLKAVNAALASIGADKIELTA